MGEAQPVLLVLGAGRGSRFVGPGHKLEQALGEGCVFSATVERALASGLPVKVVTTADLASLVASVVATRDVVLLPPPESHPELGMGYSIAAGVGAAPAAAGWLVLPADMPLVQPGSIRAVAQALGQTPVAYAQHGGRRGHPVAFHAELYSELVRLKGDEGARRVLARFPASAVEVDDPGVLLDIDTHEDLARARQAWRPAFGGGRSRPVVASSLGGWTG